jgi:hypothetical protein
MTLASSILSTVLGLVLTPLPSATCSDSTSELLAAYARDHLRGGPATS